MCVCVCVCVCVCGGRGGGGACVRASVPCQPYLRNQEAIAIKVDTMTASVTRMRHVLIISTLTFIQGHADLNHENKKCSIISETVQAMPITFAMKIVQLNVYVCNLFFVR